MTGNLRGVMAVVASALALSTMGIFGKIAFGYGLDPLNLVTLRALVAFATLLVALSLIRGRLPRLQPAHLVLFALLGLVGISVNYASFFLALQHTSVSMAIVLVYTYPAFVMLGSVLFLKESFTARKALALAFTFVGCILITEAYNTAALQLNWIGGILGLTASVTKAIYTLTSKRALAHYDPWTTVLFAFGFGALFLTIGSVATGKFSIDLSAEAWLIILAIAWIPTLIGYSLFVVGLKFLEASEASIIATLEPVTAMLLSAYILGEQIAPVQFAGVAAVISGIVLLNLPRRAPVAA